jgi:glycosyltransferase involved in cell wall biosynthesis
MRNNKPDICLVMIVRDEAHVIGRCLACVRPLITRWCIVDTGSTDDTPALIDRALAGLPGRLHRRPWVDFGHNRSESLALAAGQGDFLLLIDADETLKIADDFRWPDDPRVQAWLVRQRISGAEFEYDLPKLLRADHPWHFEGVVHEYLASRQAFRLEPLPGLELIGHYDSARNRGGNKFEQDIELLERALADEPDHARNQFYLAQSLRDAGRLSEAIAVYRRRVELGDWDEEVFYSLWQIARLLEVTGAAIEAVTEAYLAAWQFRPTRIEPLVDLARVNRQLGRHHIARLFAERAAITPRPDDILFVDTSAYRWRALDELAMALHASGERERAEAWWQGLLDAGTLPSSETGRVRDNIRSCRQDGNGAVAVDASKARVALTMTTCKRPELFERTIESFLRCCTDHQRIVEWICVDDNSTAEDRARMKARFPFFTWVWKDEQSRGHAHSMNLLSDLVRVGNFDYVLHLEDDWEFFETRNWISDALAVLARERDCGQVLFNRNYAEIPGDGDIVGGVLRETADGLRYRLHVHDTLTSPGRSCAWWPHFSLRPSLMRAGLFERVGRFDPSSDHFELDYAKRYMQAGLRSAFLDTIGLKHIGKLTTEAGENAYSLNGQVQFGG